MVESDNLSGGWQEAESCASLQPSAPLCRGSLPATRARWLRQAPHTAI